MKKSLIYVLCSLFFGSACASTVIWNSGVISGETDVVTDGQSVCAYSFGSQEVPTPSGQRPGSPVVLGITFEAFYVVNSTNSASRGNLTLSINSYRNFTKFVNNRDTMLPHGSFGLTGEYEKLIGGAISMREGTAGNPDVIDQFDITFANLEPGHTYLAQFWTNDSTVTDQPQRNMTVIFGNGSNPADTTLFNASANPGSAVQDGGARPGTWITARFVAGESGSMTLTASGWYHCTLNAVQLRDLGPTPIPEPSAALMLLASLAVLASRRNRAFGNFGNAAIPCTSRKVIKHMNS